MPLASGTASPRTDRLSRGERGNGSAQRFWALIREENADPNFQEQASQETPIYYAIRSGDLGTVETMLKHGANPNISVPNSGSPLTFATKWLKPELATGIIKALVDAGAVNNPAK